MAENNTMHTCGCVGYAYVPMQELSCTFDECTALEKGSLFPELELTMRDYGCVCKQKGGSE